MIPARTDLRADRERGVLEVCGVFAEPLPHLPARQRPGTGGRVVAALAEELDRAARWQGLEAVEVRTGEGTGELSLPLAAVIAAS